MITFITTLYNEEDEVKDLIDHVYKWVDKLVLVDDGSTDRTAEYIQQFIEKNELFFKTHYVPITHTGLCEAGRIEAMKHVPDHSWVLMLDADERFDTGVLSLVTRWIKTNPEYTHMYFDQMEYIDSRMVRTYQKAKVFKKSAITLPELIHGDPIFEGDPVSFQWRVIHRKSSTKQMVREAEYVEQYKKLLAEGKIDEGKFEWFLGLHHYVRTAPHG